MVQATLQPLHYLHVPTLRQFLRLELAELLPKAPDAVEETLDDSPADGPNPAPVPITEAKRQESEYFEHLLEDIVCLTFLVRLMLE